MRIFTLGKVLVLALVMAPMLAHSAGFGRLTVQSNIGQPLSAEIDLVSVRADEASTLAARLAAPDAYQQANLQYNPSLNGLKLGIERRPDGQYFIKVTGSRPVNEPFLDLLIELSGGGSRITREYTVLLDPPGYGQGQQAIAPAPAPQVAPARPIAAPAAPAAAAVPAVPAAKLAAPVARASGAQEYGPVAKGETLGKIAASLKPEGVSLEQMLVGLYRNNPDAFIRNNMNLVKSGKILRVPDAQQLAAIPQSDAVKEIRTQVSDWRAYSGRVADQAATVAGGGATVRGKIAGRVDEPAPADSKDVVRLSKGEPGKGGKALAGADKARALQEELIARNKELAEANQRIAQLEKTIKDTQKLAELKSPGLAAAQQKAEAAKAKEEPAKEATKEAPKEAAKAEAVKPAEPAKAEAAKADAAPAPDAKLADAAAAKDGSAPAATQPAAEAKPVPKPAPKPAAPPPPPPEPDMMDMVMDNLPLIGGGALALILGGAGVAAMRRRRARAADGGDDIEPVMPAAVAAAATAAAVVPEADAATAAPAVDDVDPVAEAEVYIAYGRDGQAEEILKEAMLKDPSREDVQVKLAEVYAARKDAASFEPVAQSLHGLTGGASDNWIKVAALGYAMDPANPLYEAGKDAAPAASAGDAAMGTDLDFDLGGDSSGTPDISLDAEPAGQATEIGGLQDMAAAADAGVTPVDSGITPDFNLDVPAPAAEPDLALEVPPVEPVAASEPASIDFNIDLPAVDAPAPDPVAAPQPASDTTDTGLDFKIDVGDLNINLDDTSTTATPSENKDSHWYDVQQKFDLAKAYQEMGDNDGAREILQEVLKEGDDGQKEQAQKLLGSLG